VGAGMGILPAHIDFQPFWLMASLKKMPIGIKKFGKNLRPFIFALPKQGV
jgi:hypothetical protein